MPIEKCDGFVYAGDFLAVIQGSLAQANVRELCGRCAMLFGDKPEAIQEFAHPLHGIPVEIKEVPCRFNHGETAVARYAMSKGCVCFPDDLEQDLCPQHASKSEPHGDFRVIKVYCPEEWRWFNIECLQKKVA